MCSQIRMYVHTYICLYQLACVLTYVKNTTLDVIYSNRIEYHKGAVGGVWYLLKHQYMREGL